MGEILRKVTEIRRKSTIFHRKIFDMVLTLTLYAVFSGGKLLAADNPNFLSIKDIPDSDWQTLASTRIYFGHQSVGNNILDGVKELIQENRQINLQIRQLTPQEMPRENSILAHSYIGKNGEPKSKMDDFADLFAKDYAEVNLAFFKFCYVDFDGATDVHQVFDYYKTTMSRLQQRHPGTTFVHVTVPLVVTHQGVKDWVKKLLGRPTNALINSKRNQFNDLLRQEIKAKALLFDLAEIESTSPDGERASFMHDGKRYHSLVPAYSDDGGHLNEKGRRIVAEQFLIFLAKIASEAPGISTDSESGSPHVTPLQVAASP